MATRAGGARDRGIRRASRARARAASSESAAFSPPVLTWAESRPAVTRAVWRRRLFSAASPPRAPSGDRLQVGAAAQVARERGGCNLRHVQALVVLLDLFADRRGV